MDYLTNETYRVLMIGRNDQAVSWNGHTWPRSYTCQVAEAVQTGPGFTDQQVRLTCGHWTSITSRFCPHCGRAVVVEV